MSPLGALNFGWGRRLPMTLQTEAAECGLVCLSMIATFFGYAIEPTDLRRRYGVSLKGATLRELVAIADQLAMASRPVRLELDELPLLNTPCVLHWDLNHFVVLKNASRSVVVIHDPAAGVRRLSLSEASKHFTGVALELTPTGGFKIAERPPRVRMRALFGNLVGIQRSLLQLLILALAIELLAMISPFFLGWVIDHALVTADRSLLLTLVVGFSLLLLLSTAISAMRGWILLVIGSSLKVQARANLFSHLLNLPTSYFESRYLGDVMSRFGSQETILQAITTELVLAVMDGLMCCISLVLMFVLAPVLTTIVVVGAVLYAVLRWATYTPLRQASAEAIVWSARRDSHFLETMRGIKTIKLFNAKEYRRAHWLNLLVETVNSQLNTQKLQLLFRTANSLLLGVLAILVIWLGAEKVLENTFSVGLLIAFIAYKDQFLKRISELINRVVDLQMLRLHAERLADIALTEPEPRTAVWDPMPRLPGPAAIEVRNLCFRYSANDRWVIDNVSFRVEAGESVAITGPSGCGKTTLLKLLAGLLQPSSGEILIDGEPLNQIGIDRYCTMIGVVMQEDQLFAGSIGDNICFFADDPDHERIQHCARMACVHDDIAMMPMRYGTLIGDMGTVLSGGQKQRVLIARALYRRPAILMLDEATSHLDVDRERAVNAAVSAAEMTRIIIAHRPETVRAADRAIVLEDGKIACCDLHPPTRGDTLTPHSFSRELRQQPSEPVDRWRIARTSVDRTSEPSALGTGNSVGGRRSAIGPGSLETVREAMPAMNEVSAHDPPPSDAVVERAPPHKRRMAGGLLSGALLCVAIAGLVTVPSDALSFLMYRLVQPISAFNLPDVDRWIRFMHNRVSPITGDARPTVDRDGLVEAGAPPVTSAAAETPEITSAERKAFTTATDQPPEPAAIVSSEAATEPKPPAPIAEVPQVIARTSPASSAGPSASSADTAAMVARGDAFVGARDITSARLFYERAIELGDGHAALRMGATFDPTFLQRTDIRGAKGDQQEALFWYRRARDLGDVEADLLLKNLER
jgi:ATP-binding cassette, subfamily B, bacterial CvaB/MchF/RaxB